MSDEEVTLVLEFDSDDTEFSRGFEAGIIWSFCARSGGFQGAVHACNAEMVMRIADSLRLPFHACEMESEDFICVTIGTPPEDED